MKKESADAWVAALRSGNYKQTPGCLKDDKGYCCLGVLCLIEGLEFKYSEESIVNPATNSKEIHYYIEERGGRKDWSAVPDILVDKLNMISANAEFETETFDEEGFVMRYDLADLNDSGKTFEEIADIIEKHWELI